MTQPLAGITVLDLSRLLPGPLCSLHLQDMGARVIKVEDTGAGDYSRSLGMPKGVISPAFHLLNRGKESISLDLTHPDASQLLLALVSEADILIESFRPGVMKKLGLNYERLQAVNPKLVMCSISGFGQSGPWAEKAGHDMNYCATAGILEQNGSASGDPVTGNFQIADIAGGALSAAMAILAAVVGSLRSGRGSYLDISMTDCAFANNLIPLAAMNLTGQAQPRGQDMLSGARPCYALYRTADNRYMAVGALEQKFWNQVCDVLQKPAWKDRYFAMGEKAEELRRDIAAVFVSQPQHYWRDLFSGADCCVTPVLTPQQAFEHPQLSAREMIQTLTTAQGQTLRFPATPFTFSTQHQPGEKHTSANPGPAQGEHTLSIVRGLNISEQQINQWLADGIIRQADI